MKYLVLFAIYKIFLYPLATKEKFSVLILFMNFFLLEYMSWRFFFLAYRSVFGSRSCMNVGSNGYNTRVGMRFHRFGW